MFIEYFDSPIGKIAIRANDENLIEVSLENYGEENKNHITSLCKIQLDEYFFKKRKSFSLPLQFSGTPFQKKVWEELKNIPFGLTVTYKELSEKIGNKNACRAVANAVGKNPFLIILPCHRVIASGNKLGGFSVGTDKKIILLEHEDIKL